MRGVADPARTSAILSVCLFGTFEAQSYGRLLKRPIRRDTERLWQLLLVQRERTRGREALATLLWPDAPPDKGRFNLRYHLHHLIGHLPPLPEPQRWVNADRDSIHWNPDAPLWWDVGAFDALLIEGRTLVDRAPSTADERLGEAVALYRADLLHDVLDDWVVGPREQRRDDVIGALDTLVALRERADRLAAALAAARRLLEIDAHRETTYRHLMRLHGRLGDRAAALEAFTACEAMLAEAYGVEPSAETVALRSWLVSAADAEPLPPPAEVRDGAPRTAFGGTAPTSPPAHLAALPDAPADGLPHLVSRFVGRRHDVAEIARALEHARLVTLIGAGGIGKTRLALEVARAARGRFGSQVAWVALDSVSDGAQVGLHVARAVMDQPPDDAEPRAALCAHFGAQRALLVCDNCEHVLAEIADLVAALLHACPNVAVLATSRSPLQIEGEQRRTIRPLSLVPTDGAAPLDGGDLEAASEAGALFLDRVRSIQHDYRPSPAAVAAIADICARVDGIPLAIELAAARINLMTAEEIAQRLARDLGILTAPGVHPRARHDTIEASIAWSYGLLGEAERRFLTNLTVFPRSFDLRAVTEVAGGGDLAADMVPNLLSLLIDKSLVMVEVSANQRRFRLLEPIRTFVIDRALASRGPDAPAEGGAGEQPRPIDLALADRHAAYFLAEAERAEAALAREASAQAEIRRLEGDAPNFVAAQAHFVQRGDLESARRLVGALWRFWYRRGFSRQQRDALRLLVDVRPEPAPSIGLAKTQLAIGATSYRVGEHGAAQVAFAAAAAAFEALGMTESHHVALVQLATSYMADGHLAQAQAQLERVVDERRALGAGQALTGNLNTLAHLYWRQGKYDDASRVAAELLNEASAGDQPNFDLIRAHYALALVGLSRAEYPAAEAHLQTALEAARALGQRDSAASQETLLGILYTLRGDYDKAHRALRSSVDADRGTGNEMRAARDLHNLGELALAQGDYAVAHAMLGRSLEMKTRLGDTLGLIYTLLALAALACETDDLESARRWEDQAAALVEPSGEASLLAWHQSVAARTALAGGDVARAAAMLEPTLAFSARVGERRRLAINLERAALLAQAVGRDADALGLAGAAADLRSTIGAPRTAGEARDLARAGLAEGAAAVGAAAPALGAAVSLAKAVVGNVHALRRATEAREDP